MRRRAPVKDVGVNGLPMMSINNDATLALDGISS